MSQRHFVVFWTVHGWEVAIFAKGRPEPEMIGSLTDLHIDATPNQIREVSKMPEARLVALITDFEGYEKGVDTYHIQEGCWDIPELLATAVAVLRGNGFLIA